MERARLMRVWRGWTRRADAEAYERYLRRTGLPGYTAVPGNLGVRFTRRDVGANSEFCLISFWDSYEAVAEFAGETADRAVFYPDDDRFLVDRDLTVAHYVIFESA